MPTAQSVVSGDGLEEKYLRALADLENMRKRTLHELKLARTRGEDNVLFPVLSLLDDLYRAMEAMDQVRGRGTKQKLMDGLRAIVAKFQSVLLPLGVQEFESKGKMFEAHCMEAVAQSPSLDQRPGTVVGEVCCGYTRDGRLLRPAKVAVAVKP